MNAPTSRIPLTWHGLSLLVLLLSAFSRFFPHGTVLYSDPFHHGEYVATLPAVLAGGSDFFTIHGALDWLPAWLAAQGVGVARYFLPTMFLFHLLDLLAGLLLYLIVVQQSSSLERYRFVVLFATAALACYLVGHRDFFLLTSVWLFFALSAQDDKPIRFNLLALTLGLSLALNVFWSFDRGLAGLLGLGSACLLGLATQHRYGVVLLTTTLVLLGLVQSGWMPVDTYLANLRFLLDTSAQWRYGSDNWTASFLTVVAAIPNLVATYWLARRFRRAAVERDWSEAARLLAWLALCVLMFKAGTNRADSQHVVMALWIPWLTLLSLSGDRLRAKRLIPVARWLWWPPLLAIFLFSISHPLFLLLLLAPALYALEVRHPQRAERIQHSRLAIFTLAFIVLAANVQRAGGHYVKQHYAWLAQLSNPPSNVQTVDNAIRWVVGEFQRQQARCVFDMSFGGVINGVTGLPACTRYTYPIYANTQYEDHLLAQLQQQHPPLVIASSYWWGTDWQQRFPKLHTYLQRTYPYEQCHLQYCLRYSQPTFGKE